ncbi:MULTISPECIES: alpha/beta hydrolase [Cysteiniphilum]|uniref:Carboxylesterase n=1 Tax=Cysteiniphilum litorale TaxID=2056700 RepID=A0A8J2Z486_9GAMM|nr:MULTISPECIES: carboxylesterase [Cysteiniphilum]GGF97818.1 carboxylesterase [Cysteiniphilum litorale]
MRKKSIIIEPITQARSCVIWLHGLGARRDFSKLVPEFDLPINHSIRFIFPFAEINSLTINKSESIHSWYDIKSVCNTTMVREIDITSALYSCAYIHSIIDQQIKLGILPHNIILIGFSQGALIAGLSSLTTKHALAASMIISGYLPEWSLFARNIQIPHKHTNYICMHGMQDTIIPIKLGTIAKDMLIQHGYNVTWHTYETGHELCFDAIQKIRSILAEKLIDISTLQINSH